MADNNTDIGGWLFFGAVLAVAGFATVTKPDRGDFERELRFEIDEGLRSGVGNGNIAERISKIPCSQSRDSCANLFRQRISVTFDDYVVVRSANVFFDQIKIDTCIGGFNSWRCGF